MSAIQISPREQAIAEHAVQRQIEELRSLGFDVEVLSDLKVCAVVRVSGMDASPVEMAIDPHGYMQRLREMDRRRLN